MTPTTTTVCVHLLADALDACTAAQIDYEAAQLDDEHTDELGRPYTSAARDEAERSRAAAFAHARALGASVGTIERVLDRSGAGLHPSRIRQIADAGHVSTYFDQSCLTGVTR